MLKLATPHFLLRDFLASDIDAYFALRDDDKFQRFYPEADRSRQKAQCLLEMFIAQSLAVPRQKFQLAITNQADELIGSIGLRIEAPGVASLGCELGRRWQASGAAKEVAQVMLDFGFHDLQLQRIFAETMADNKAAIKLCMALGMQIEETKTATHYFKSRAWDSVLLAINKPSSVTPYSICEHETSNGMY